MIKFLFLVAKSFQIFIKFLLLKPFIAFIIILMENPKLNLEIQSTLIHEETKKEQEDNEEETQDDSKFIEELYYDKFREILFGKDYEQHKTVLIPLLPEELRTEESKALIFISFFKSQFSKSRWGVNQIKMIKNLKANGYDEFIKFFFQIHPNPNYEKYFKTTK